MIDPETQRVDSSRKRSPQANIFEQGSPGSGITTEWFQERVEQCMHGVKRGMHMALAAEFRHNLAQATDAQDPGEGLISSQWLYRHVEEIAELGRRAVELHVAKTREATIEKLVQDGEESGRSWIQRCKQQLHAFLCSYVSTLVASLDRLGFREVITREELQHLRMCEILRPDLNSMSPASFVRRCGAELGIQRSNSDFEAKLMFCRAYAFRKGIHETLRELGSELNSDERRVLEKKISSTWEEVRSAMDSVSLTSAYSEGRIRAEEAVRIAQAQKHSPAIKL